ncbi:unnamed protein product, partial [Symbiodinium pilosum]
MARTVDPHFNILEKVYPFALNTLLSNPSDSPVLRQTLRNLCSDGTGRLSMKQATSLVDSAAKLTGNHRRTVVADSLRSPGGRRFFRALVRSEAAKLWGRIYG